MCPRPDGNALIRDSERQCRSARPPDIGRCPGIQHAHASWTKLERTWLRSGQESGSTASKHPKTSLRYPAVTGQKGDGGSVDGAILCRVQRYLADYPAGDPDRRRSELSVVRMRMPTARAFRLQAVVSVVVVGALVAAVTVSSLGHGGTASSQLDLSGGTAWFADSAAGTVSLLDGATGSRVGVQVVARVGDHIQVVQSDSQSGAGAYVIDHSTGNLSRVDGATLVPGRPVRFGPPGDADLAMASNPKATWIVEQDGTLAEEVDPSSLAPVGSPLPLSSSGAAPIETPDGTLWTSGAGGDVYSFAAGLPHTRTHPGAGQFSLVEAESRPVAAAASAGQALVLNPRTGRTSRSVPFNPPATAPLISGSGDAPYLMAVGPSDGDLQVTDLTTTRSAAVPIGDPSTGVAGYGPAVINGDLIFVPVLEQAAIVVAEVQHDQLTVLGQVSVDDHHFQLLNYDSSVWFDDPNTNLAGVITPNLTAILIPKTGGNGKGRVISHLVPLHYGHTAPPAPPTAPPPITVKTTTPPAGATTPPTSAATPPTSPPPTTGKTTPLPVAPAPNFTWSPNPATAGHAVTFTDTSTGPHQIFQWTFGPGGTTSTAVSPSFTWSTPATYTVTLVITSHGSSYPVQKLVTVTAAIRAVRCITGTRTIGPGTPLTWTVPPGCTHAAFTVFGGAGGSSISNGFGAGNRGATLPGGGGSDVLLANYPVVPGDQFQLTAGGAGESQTTQPTGGPGGAPGGGSGGCSGIGSGPGGGGGGGMSSVVAGSARDNYLIIAGGGGGASQAANGDAADGRTPEDGTIRSGGTNSNGTRGSQYQGGNGKSLCGGISGEWGGGGGGAGLNGGAGGAIGDPSFLNVVSQGGGGSDLLPRGAVVSPSSNPGPGKVTVSWSQ